MEVLGTAVGVASLGIQVCQGLITYFNTLKSYDSDIDESQSSVTQLRDIFTLLKLSLRDDQLEAKRATRAGACLSSCYEKVQELKAIADELRKHSQPQSTKQKIQRELQRAAYPFRAATLEKQRVMVRDLRDQLQLALQALGLDSTLRQGETLKRLEEQAARTEARIMALQQSADYREIAAWLAPPDPWKNHNSARLSREPQTCDWLLRSDTYQRWKAGSERHIWLYGKPGCGKTILCSTAIEDIQAHCQGNESVWSARFYFSFSDQKKQTYDDLLSSLVTQLSWKEPALAMLQQVHKRQAGAAIARDELENILISVIQSFKTIYLMLDALDESPTKNDARYHMLQHLEKLAKKASNIKIFATSRELPDIREALEAFGVQKFEIGTLTVDNDIAQYVSRRLDNDRRFGKLSNEAKASIEKALSENADGMFLWADRQLTQLAQLKPMKQEHIDAALKTMPMTLDATYERMLLSIGEVYRDDALKLLQWLVYAERPLTLAELAHTVAIKVSDDGDDEVEPFRNEDLEDPLDILAGLISISREIDADTDIPGEASGFPDVRPGETINCGSGGLAESSNRRSLRVRLAHFSVKEYLVSDHVVNSKAERFSMNQNTCDEIIGQSCLAYVMHYSKSAKHQKPEDFSAFPLLQYAAESWFIHMSRVTSPDWSRTILLLDTEAFKSDWIYIHDPEYLWKFLGSAWDIGSALYYASSFGLVTLVQQVLDDGADPNMEGGAFDTPLQVASRNGYIAIIKMLLNGGADFGKRGSKGDSALSLAAEMGNIDIVRLLLEHEAAAHSQSQVKSTVQTTRENSYGAYHARALESAAEGGHGKIVKMLLEAGADVNAKSSAYSTVLTAAIGSRSRNERKEEMVKMLIEAGADVNAAGRYGNNALQQAAIRGQENILTLLLNSGAIADDPGALCKAAFWGHDKVVQILLDRGADVDAEDNFHGSALQAASWRGQELTALFWISKGAKINAQGGYLGNALQAASCGAGEFGDFQGFELEIQANSAKFTKVVALLLREGAEVNAYGGHHGTALQAASYGGPIEVVQLLLESQANVNQEGAEFGSALQAAADRGNIEVLQLLLDNGADVNMLGGKHGTALQAASSGGYIDAVQLLLQSQANVNALGGTYGTALQAAAYQGNKEVVELLLNNGADINAVGGRYGTALQAASCKDFLEISHLLLGNGADVNARGGEYGTALQAAAREGHVKSIRLLLENSADLTAPVAPFGGALFAPLKGGHHEAFRLLLAKWLNQNTSARDGLGRSRLHLAAAYGEYATVAQVLRDGADIDMVDNHGWTPLHWAAYFGNERTIACLLKSGADIMKSDSQNWTARDVALFAGHEAAVASMEQISAPIIISRAGTRGEGFCNACSNNLIGYWHRCADCGRFSIYDLCFRCFRDVLILHSGHDDFSRLDDAGEFESDNFAGVGFSNSSDS